LAEPALDIIIRIQAEVRAAIKAFEDTRRALAELVAEASKAKELVSVDIKGMQVEIKNNLRRAKGSIEEITDILAKAPEDRLREELTKVREVTRPLVEAATDVGVSFRELERIEPKIELDPEIKKELETVIGSLGELGELVKLREAPRIEVREIEEVDEATRRVARLQANTILLSESMAKVVFPKELFEDMIESTGLTIDEVLKLARAGRITTKEQAEFTDTLYDWSQTVLRSAWDVGYLDRRLRYLSRDYYVFALTLSSLMATQKKFLKIVAEASDLSYALSDATKVLGEAFAPVADAMAEILRPIVEILEAFGKGIEGLHPVIKKAIGAVWLLVMAGGWLLTQWVRLRSALILFIRSTVGMTSQQRLAEASTLELARAFEALHAEYLAGIIDAATYREKLLLLSDGYRRLGADVGLVQTLFFNKWSPTLKEQIQLTGEVRQQISGLSRLFQATKYWLSGLLVPFRELSLSLRGLRGELLATIPPLERKSEVMRIANMIASLGIERSKALAVASAIEESQIKRVAAAFEEARAEQEAYVSTSKKLLATQEALISSQAKLAARARQQTDETKSLVRVTGVSSMALSFLIFNLAEAQIQTRGLTGWIVDLIRFLSLLAPMIAAPLITNLLRATGLLTATTTALKGLTGTIAGLVSALGPLNIVIGVGLVAALATYLLWLRIFERRNERTWGALPRMARKARIGIEREAGIADFSGLLPHGSTPLDEIWELTMGRILRTVRSAASRIPRLWLSKLERMWVSASWFRFWLPAIWAEMWRNVEKLTLTDLIMAKIDAFITWLVERFPWVRTVINLLWTAWQEVSALLEDPIGRIRGWIESFVSWLEERFPWVKTIINILLVAWRWVERFLSDPVGAIKGVISSFIAWLKEHFPAIEPIINLLFRAWKAVESLLQDPLGTIKSWISSFIAWLKEKFPGLFPVIRGFLDVWDEIKASIKDPIGYIREKIQGFINWLSGRFPQAAAIIKSLGRAWETLRERIRGIIESIRRLISGFLDWLRRKRGEATFRPVVTIPRLTGAVELQRGGWIRRAGLYMLHPGEIVLPERAARELVVARPLTEITRTLRRESSTIYIQPTIIITREVSPYIDEALVGDIVTRRIAEEFQRV